MPVNQKLFGKWITILIPVIGVTFASLDTSTATSIVAAENVGQ